jgi:hypothetical protein
MTGGVNNHPTTSEEANGIATDFVTEGVIGTISNTSGVAPSTGAFAVNAQGTPNMTVAVTSGVAYVTGTPSSQNSQTFRVYSSASENVTISANSSGSTKYDWVYIKLDATLLNAPTLAGDTTATLVTSRSTSNSSDDGTPPTYSYPLAIVTVANGASSITNSVIRDIRSNADIGAVAGANTGWTTGALPQISSVTENGNRSASITFASTVANILTPGMRIRTTRTVAAPAQSTSLNGTTQYYSKSSPNKLTFTDDFTCMAWIRLTSYNGATNGIITRFSSSGWLFRLTTSGQVEIYADNGAVSRAFTSYQSIPLNKWVHVAASLDMSGGSGVIYIDGISVPVFSSGGAGTVLIQAGNLNIGATAGTAFFAGTIAQAAVFSAVLTAATIRSYKNQGLSGSETNLASAYSFNNSITDLNTTTPNDLTANGSAVATNAASPFATNANGTAGGSLDYAIVTNVSTTVATVQYAEGCAIPTSGGISAVDYSGVKAPFGMPIQRSRWQVLTLNKVAYSQGAPASGTWYNTSIGAIQILLPVGSWDFGYSVQFGGFKSAAVLYEVYCTLSTTSSTETDFDLTSWISAEGALGTITPRQLCNRTKRLDVSTATQYYFNGETSTASGGDISTYGSYGSSLVTADLSYL